MDSTDGQVPHIGINDVDLQPGQQVGEYVVDCKIGEGGFGTVFRAAHPLIGKIVAIKVLNRQYSAQPEMVSRFVAEARAVNQIRHRNIIDIFSFGQLEDGRHYYVMEYLDGAPLDEHLDRVGAMPLKEAIPVLRAIARALDAAHAKGIAHRDLKPENVFLATEADGAVFPKLLDFGIAKLLSADTSTSHKTRTGAPIGTPYYMSPEQCRGRDVDHRTDIYAFGIMSYKLLTGEVPFDGDDYMEILLKQISEEAPPPSSKQPSLPASIDDGIAWMLKKNPSERPPNLVTAVRALEDAATAAGVAVPAGPVPTGVYAASTSRVYSQGTPGRVTPLSSASTAGDFGSAATMAAPGATVPTPVPGAIDDVPARGSRVPLIALGLGLALATGVVVFMAMRSGSSDEAQVVSPPGDAIAQSPAAVPDAGALAAGGANPTPGDRPQVAPPSTDQVAAADASVPVLSETVSITLVGGPAGATVKQGRRDVGTTPGPIVVKRSAKVIRLTVSLDGYLENVIQLTPDGDKEIEFVLKKRRERVNPGGKPPQDKPPGGRNTIEDPFR